MDAFDEMQERLQQLGMNHMLLRQRSADEMRKLCADIDARWESNETRLQIATRRRDERRQKKQDRRAAAEVCLIVVDERRGIDRRRGK